MSVLTRTFARNPFDAVSIFSAVPECAFGCELGSTLTMKTRTVAILSRHAILLRISGGNFEI
jgi:hypothetical protein